MTTDRPFIINPELTGIALAYMNDEYIADSILPRVPVSKTIFAYNKYSNNAFTKTVDARIGRKGEPETLEIKKERKLAECEAFSIMVEVPEEDVITARDSGESDNDPMGTGTLLATEALKLSREVRVAELLANDKIYGANVTTLTKSDSFVNKESSVIDVYKDVLGRMPKAPNYAVISSANALYLQTHPDFLSIYKSVNTDNKGLVPLDFVAQQLGLKKIYAGSAKAEAPKGKNTLAHVWGNDMVFFYQNPNAKPEMGMTFGLTGEYKTMNVQTYFDGKKGSYGLNYVKPVEMIKELILAGSCGYLVKDAFVKA